MSKKYRAIRVQLGEMQRKQMTDLIKEELGFIADEYEDRQFYQYNAKVMEEYRGAKKTTDFPVKNGSNRNMLLTTMMTDIVSHRAAYQTNTANPMYLLEAEEKIDASELVDRQDYLDFKCRERLNLPAVRQIWYKYALLQRTAVIKTLQSEVVEYFKKETVYNVENQKEFENKFLSKLLNPESKESAELKSIIAGEEVTKTEDVEKIMYYGPKCSRVSLDNFMARLSIKDFNKQRVHGEDMVMQWSEIAGKYEEGWYDKDPVLEIMQFYPKDYYKRQYNIGEFIVRAALKAELDPNGEPPKTPAKLMKYLVTYDIETDKVLRCIHYPFEHNTSMYSDMSAYPSDETWWNEGIYDRLEDTTSIANATLNAMINSFALAHMPIIACNDPQFDGGRVMLENLSVLKFGPGTMFQQFKYDNPPTDQLSLLQFIMNLSELIVGVSASLASGQETPGDAGAPAAKTAMKMQASNMRITDLIVNMQLADAKIAEQIDALCYQYAKDSKEDSYFRGNEEKTVKMAVLKKKVRYVTHGSRTSFDKSMDQQTIIHATGYIAKLSPQTLADVEVAYTLLSSYINSSEGSVEKNRDVILAPLKNIVEAKQEIKKMMELIKTEQNGKPTPEQAAMLEKMGVLMGMPPGGQGGAPGQPGQPPGAPPGPPAPPGAAGPAQGA